MGKVVEKSRADAEDLEKKNVESMEKLKEGVEKCARLEAEFASGQRNGKWKNIEGNPWTVNLAHKELLLKIAKGQKTNFEKQQQVAEKQRQNIIWMNIFRYVVTENAPSLSLTTSFFCLAFESMTKFALLKNM